MFSLSRKFLFDAALLPVVIPAHAPGCTVVDAAGNFEVATDDDLSALGGVEVGIYQALAFRVTARTLDGLLYWVSCLIKDVAGEGARVSVTAQRGYWQPTDEWEASWLIETGVRDLTQAQLGALYAWLVAEDQQAAYIEYQGKVLIPDREEVPSLLEHLS